ncbi:DUF3793 family protein [Wukongibacter baidiensis]|uniref:DUF3793 family protein n=1 Tax=Wukongibacter baidiensis TaxID=1723361 RepID=UPI003D7F3ADD
MAKCSDSCILAYKRNNDFIGWLVEILGPVLMGSKPAELLSFPKHEKQLLRKIDSIEKHMGKCKRVTYRLFKNKSGSIKVLFYNPKSLDTSLQEYRNMRFLKNLGYPSKYGLDEYLQIIIDKMITGDIPHEIGVFLGYPLKDIIGFIGHPSLKLTKVNGWRVYGDPRLSDKRLNEFIEAKNKVRKLLEFNEPEKVLVSI